MQRTHRPTRRGLTLVESLIAAAVLTVVVLAVSQALNAGQMQAYDAAHRARAIELAEALMDEIVRLPYADSGVDDETTRATFDDIDDFHNFSETGVLRDAADAAYPAAYQVFERSVTVTAASQAVAGIGPAIEGLNITVTVMDGTGLAWTLQQFIPEPAE